MDPTSGRPVTTPRISSDEHASTTVCRQPRRQPFRLDGHFVKRESMTELKFLGCLDCIQYQTRAVFFIDSTGEAGLRHLLVLYENGHPPFRAGIPNDWAEADVRHLMIEDDGTYPAWEQGRSHARLPDVDQAVLNSRSRWKRQDEKTSAPLLAAKFRKISQRVIR